MADIWHEHNIALNKCVAGIKLLQAAEASGVQPSYTNIEALDIDELSKWHNTLESDIKAKMEHDEIFMRAVLGYEHFCLNFVTH